MQQTHKHKSSYTATVASEQVQLQHCKFCGDQQQQMTADADPHPDAAATLHLLSSLFHNVGGGLRTTPQSVSANYWSLLTKCGIHEVK